MRPIVQTNSTGQTPESLARQLRHEPGLVVLRSALFDSPQARYSFVAADPFLTFHSAGSHCSVTSSAPQLTQSRYGSPWHVLDSLMARFELLDEIDLPFPLGGCFGYWGYDLKNFVEPKLPRHALNDLELPDCHVGFYDSLVAFDHHLGTASVVSTGLKPDGSRSEERARMQLDLWQKRLAAGPGRPTVLGGGIREGETENAPPLGRKLEALRQFAAPRYPVFPVRDQDRLDEGISSNLTRPEFLSAVARAQAYIRAGDIYQVNLSQRLRSACPWSGYDLFERLLAVSPAPFAAYFDCGTFQVASSSPEQFLRLSGQHIVTRPIKGTRPRSPDATRDAQLAYELRTSAKELAELVMITDLLRNDLGRVCEFGSVQVPELAKLERFPQVQHLVSTVEGRLRWNVTHFAALSACFPGGSITGAPKFRAMEVIDELEPLARGPYCGCHGYLGFNRESQLSVSIRTAIRHGDHAYFHVGAGIVADSTPEAEYDETLAKARGFQAALRLPDRLEPRLAGAELERGNVRRESSTADGQELPDD